MRKKYLLALVAGCLLACADVWGESRVGVIIPLTGPLSQYGEATRNGIELARLENLEALGAIRFLYEDSQYDSKVAVPAFHKLRQADGASLVFVWGTGPTQALAPLAETYRMPLVAQTTESGISQGRKYVVRFSIYAEQYSIALLEYLRARGLSRFCVLKDEFAFFDQVVTGMQQHLKPGESIEIMDSVVPQERDFRSLIAKMKGRNLDAAGIFLLSGQVGPFFSQAAALGMSKPIFGADTFDSPNEAALLRGYPAEVIYPHIFYTEKFRSSYTRRFGSDSLLSFAALAYDFALAAGQSLRGNDSGADGAAIAEAFKAVNLPAGATGHTRYVDEGGGAGFRFSVAIERAGNLSPTPALAAPSS